MKKKRDLFSHSFLVVASLFMLFSVTVAWFLTNSVADTSPMSFASQWLGAGARVYPGTVDMAARSYDPAMGTLTNTVTWGSAQEDGKASITIEKMVPGQCAYYMLLGNVPLDIYLEKITIDGSTTEAYKAPLAQCLAVYLIPLSEAQLVPPSASLQEKAKVTCNLKRGVTGQLEATPFKNVVGSDPIRLVPSAPAQEYVLAVFCDPVYLQDGEIHEITGNVSFSMTFATQG